jgi:hypothetical protein
VPDGQVTVWDRRSSKPYAVFHTTVSGTPLAQHTYTPESPISPASGADDALAGLGLNTTATSPPREQHTHLLVDPVSGASRHPGSSSGREAARVVKFSPEGSPRDLLVFTEENSNLHIVDAKTFNTHLVVPVPRAVAAGTAAERERENAPRDGEHGYTGIAGVAFDPTGNWLYSGTESTVVEWDMRRLGASENSVWHLN